MLTDVKVRNARAADKPYKLPDAGGLHLHVATSGRRTWRWRYQRDGRERLVVLGAYPEVSLREAREDRDRRRHEMRQGIVVAMSSPTLTEIARRWHATNAARWKPHHAADVLGSLEREAFPKLGGIPIRNVTAPMILTELRRIETRGAIETAHVIRGRLSRIFAFAIGEGVAELNPAEMIRAAMMPMPKGNHRPAVTTIEAARDVLQKCEAIPAYPLTRLALRLLALTALRPGEVAGGMWSEDEGVVWRIPPRRMKMDREHVVPLSSQAREVLDVARTLSGRTPFMFPGATSSRVGMSENALNVMLRRAGLSGVHVPHGWRATFSTVMNERFPADRLVIDLMLAHAPAGAKGSVEAAYNRSERMERRRELAQVWADLLLTDAPPARELVELRRKT